MPAFEIAAVGDNCIDRYGAPMNLSCVGGNAVNVAVQLAAQGAGAAYFGAVGDDADGRRTVAALAARGVDVAQLRIRPGVTAYTDICFAAGGERVFAFEEFGACRGYAPDAAEVAILAKLRHVHIGWLDDGGALKRRLAAAGVSVSQDLSVNAASGDVAPDALAVAFLSANSREEAAASLHRALAAGARVAVATMGGLGSLASDGTDFAEARAEPVDAVDTTGAGDTFIAAFIATHLRGLPLAASLAAAGKAAAATCLHVGGFPQDPVPLAQGSSCC